MPYDTFAFSFSATGNRFPWYCSSALCRCFADSWNISHQPGSVYWTLHKSVCSPSPCSRLASRCLFKQDKQESRIHLGICITQAFFHWHMRVILAFRTFYPWNPFTWLAYDKRSDLSLVSLDHISTLASIFLCLPPSRKWPRTVVAVIGISEAVSKSQQFDLQYENSIHRQLRCVLRESVTSLSQFAFLTHVRLLEQR